MREWFLQDTRITAQPRNSVLAACHRLEHEFPVLARCSQHWKSMKLLKQIVDNRKDRAQKCRRQDVSH